MFNSFDSKSVKRNERRSFSKFEDFEGTLQSSKVLDEEQKLIGIVKQGN